MGEIYPGVSIDLETETVSFLLTAYTREARNRLLPLLLRRGDQPFLIDETTLVQQSDKVEWLVLEEPAAAAHQRLEEQVWTMVEEVPMEAVDVD